MRLSIAHLSRPKPGEVHNGDTVVIRQEGEHTLFGVVDGLGHGLAASVAADASQKCLATTPLDRGLFDVMTALHHALVGTRGIAVLLGLFGGNEFELSGVGNVEIRTQGSRLTCVQEPGVLGHQVKRIRTFRSSTVSGDRLALFSDGLSTRLRLEDARHMSGQEACNYLLKQYARENDDATVLVADVEA